MMRAGRMNRMVQFRRAAAGDDGFSDVVSGFENHGPAVCAEKIEISDAERLRNDQLQATINARFLIWHSVFAADLTAKDRLICEGRTFEIFGIKEIGLRAGFEVTAGARVDVAAS